MRLFNKRTQRAVALFFAIVLVNQAVAPTVVYALTSGPSQPEVSSFEPVGMTEMVDPFTGDFTYNIPLFELPGPSGGYPFNLSYHAGVGMDDEASWVGLGWNLNAGAITRHVRGLPDEFNGDEIISKKDINPSVTYGVEAGAGVEILGKEINASGSLGLAIKNNNYNGLGYSISSDIGFQGAISESISKGGASRKINLDPEVGVSVTSIVGLTSKFGEFGLSSNYNSKAGLQSVSANYQKFIGLNEGYFAHPSYTPYVQQPMEFYSISAAFKVGASFVTVYPHAYVRGFYSESKIKDRGRPIASEAYGYLNIQNRRGLGYVLDFNREKEGLISIDHPNLASPVMTPDTYQVTAQGMMGTFRPVRNENVLVSDAPQLSQSSTSFGAGVDAGFGKIGINSSINSVKHLNTPWTEENGLNTVFQSSSQENNRIYEPWYFRKMGSRTAESLQDYNSIGKDQAIKPSIFQTSALRLMENENGSYQPPTNHTAKGRKARNEVLVPHTNDEILLNGEPVIDEFKIYILNENGESIRYDRSGLPKHHITGFVAVGEDGLRYNYTLPVYNFNKEEITFSTASHEGVLTFPQGSENNDPNYKFGGTEELLNNVKTPPHAYAYLLTSVTGPDYVDVENDGISDDDLGYWVKFTYRQAATKDNPYKWRDPFVGAHFLEGFKSDPRDDKGSFTFGEKEVYYLARAETKSHVAIFDLKNRKDATGVFSKLQNGNNTVGKSLMGLKSITLFTKAGFPEVPIKKVNFEYDYSLCNGIPNIAAESGGSNELATGPTGGKLTLKKLYFEYGNSQRGKLNPYEFAYAFNPDYDILAYDRWGNFKPKNPLDETLNRDMPYVDQNPGSKSSLDENAASWSLTDINLPSGGRMKIDYEIDDYAYVQHLEAMYMAPIVDPDIIPGQQAPDKFILNNGSKVRFKLKAPISETLTKDLEEKEVKKYLDIRRGQVYFKAFVNLRDYQKEQFFEAIEGYVDLDLSKGMGLEKGASGHYEFGYFHLQHEVGNYHPFSLRAWQHIQSNQPHLMNLTGSISPTNNRDEQIREMRKLPSLIPMIKEVFGQYYSYCEKKNWGKQFDLSRSVVRLNSPDKIKFGGGLRVRQLTMFDGWEGDGESVYGKVFDYTMEENGQSISSGVAAYEPFIGGEENALRYAKKFSRSIPLKANNNLFFEYPVNESLYPGPHIGYAKVTEMSLPAAYRAGLSIKNLPQTYYPSRSNATFGTTGAKVYEFYTAKDFPTRSYETQKEDYEIDYRHPLSILGIYTKDGAVSSQGYSLISNDMHGKPKKESSFRQGVDGSINPEPYQWTAYTYLAKEIIYDDKKAFALINDFEEDGEHQIKVGGEPGDNTVSMGQLVELVTDMSESQTNTWQGGADGNLDLVKLFFLPIPVPAIWPKVSKSESLFRVAVTNKIITQTGILQAVETYNEGSLISSKNLAWDKQTGEPVLVQVNNNFDDPLYNYKYLAFRQYKGMGGAYQNLKFAFDINTVMQHTTEPNLYTFRARGSTRNFLQEGDELIIYSREEGEEKILTKAVFLQEEGGRQVIHPMSPISMDSQNLYAKITRSGYSNQLRTSAGSIVSLSPPFTGDTAVYSSTIKVPSGKAIR
ncbi:hypothetical protein [Litoribacter populi]|uniref:hypothetical protein n=1 Tax=Litoribacter populi TaxID=2598460 RepID=UPI00117CB023|nr:hypothetical protein [Litoribacter populi]